VASLFQENQRHRTGGETDGVQHLTRSLGGLDFLSHSNIEWTKRYVTGRQTDKRLSQKRCIFGSDVFEDTCRMGRWSFFGLGLTWIDLGPILSMRQHYRLSICPPISVRHRKTVEVRIVKFSPYGSPMTSFCGVSFIQGQTREGWENEQFFGFKRQYLENGNRYGQSYY